MNRSPNGGVGWEGERLGDKGNSKDLRRGGGGPCIDACGPFQKASYHTKPPCRDIAPRVGAQYWFCI